MSESNHGRPVAPPPSFSAEDVAAPTHAERVRTLIARHKVGALSTLAIDPSGYPYGSFITFALLEGDPIFLISRLAEHTRNLLGDARGSLLVHDSDSEDPLANGRVTLLGRAQKLERGPSAERDAYLEAHPQAAYYADFSDFDVWRLSVEALRYIGGYGRMSWVSVDDYKRAAPDPLASAAAFILQHMNTDHADSLVLYARAFSLAHDAEAATMTAIDRLGFELTVKTPRGIGPARVAFDAPLTSADQARPTLVALVRAARAKLGQP